MAKCWAAILGQCSPTQSSEHYLSQSLWDSNEITVKGFWGEVEKTIPVASLTVNALCRSHNSNLSALDTGIRKISDTISEFHRLAEVRAKIGKHRLSSVVQFRVDGGILERWAAKFVVGLFCAIGKKSHWHETGSGPLNPSEKVVKAIYGFEPFQEPMGLYLAYEVGDRHYHERGVVRAETLIHPDDGGVLGANIELNGFRFIMWLHPKVPGTSAFSGVLIGPRGAALTYHPKKAIFKHASQELIFEWASFSSRSA